MQTLRLVVGWACLAVAAILSLGWLLDPAHPENVLDDALLLFLLGSVLHLERDVAALRAKVGGEGK